MSTATERTSTAGITRRSDEAERRIAHLKRLGGCLGLAFVLALMIGNQEGTQQDFGFAFRQAVLGPRILVFLLVGVLIYLAVTFSPYLTPYLRRPGIRPLAAGAVSVVAAYGLLKWTDSDQIDTGKLSTLAKAGRDTGALGALNRLFFGSAVPGLYWLLLVVTVVLGVASVVRRNRVLCYVTIVVAVVAGLWGFSAQASVRSLLGTPDHSTGGLVSLLGYLTIAASALTVARSVRDEADTRGFVDRVFAWRPGMPLVVAGAVLGLISFLAATWFSPTNKNDKVWNLPGRFDGTGITGLSSAYVTWLLYVLFLGTLAVAAFASYRRHRALGWVALGLGVVSLLVTLVVMHDLGSTAAGVGFDGATSAWQDFGVGAWLMAAVFTLLAGAGWIAATVDHRGAAAAATGSDTLAVGTDNIGRVLLVAVIAGALFYPPTATQFWQTVLVTEIGIFVLLAIGLNVVVGWAGLLDLGFIAFYAIGSYTTAFLTDRLPAHPPSWLHLTPLQAIPFAILVCLIAGVLLGAPTLRLRGDYLAIVTLGFGEIVRVVANNGESVTNGARGAFNIPPPSIHLGPLHFTWGGSALGFWYLLLVLVVIVVVLFHRLEDSRLGRAWAAVREDEVAAQATGINTTRVKLLAFAIGASTSGVAGVFFASQVGSFTPENFILNNSILVVAYVVFGGMGSLPGAMAGAAVLTWLPEFLKDQVPAEDRQMWIGAAILIMMIFRPSGLIPARRRKAELSGLDRPSSAESTAVPAGEGM
jgi:ABC-type branched-subunit amino acid transport system permease subunit